MSGENIEKIPKSGRSFAPALPDINFNGHCLINNISILKKVINLYVSYNLNPQLRNLNTDFTLGNCLFESEKSIVPTV